MVLLLQVLFFADKKMEIEVRRTKRTKTCYGFYQEKATKGFSLLDSWFYSKSLGRIRITSEIKLIKVARPLLHENLVKKDICYHIIAGLKMEPLENLSREKKVGVSHGKMGIWSQKWLKRVEMIDVERGCTSWKNGNLTPKTLF